MDKSSAIRKIPFILLTGFLGSGKTSLLKQILNQVGGQKKIAIVQNEFAPGKTDSAELLSQGQDIQILDVNKGSVFCVCQLDSFIHQLEAFLQEHQPELIFLEATGLADPISIGQILEAEPVADRLYLASIWTVIDAHNFSGKLQFIQRVQHQIQIADLLILNKHDLNRLDENDQNLISSWNPNAKQVLAVHGKFTELQALLNQIIDNEITSQVKLDNDQQTGAGRPDIGTCVIRTQKIISKETIHQFWLENKHKIYRMKGFIRVGKDEYCLVHSIFDRIEIEPVDFWSGASELIFIGPGISGSWLRKELNK